MEKVTIDIREKLGDGFPEEALVGLFADQHAEGREVTEIFCTEAQAETIKGFVKEVKKGKKLETVEKYTGIKLTVA